MPKAINYKANSVVYFSGDFDERVFLLNTGSIALTSIDIDFFNIQKRLCSTVKFHEEKGRNED